MSLKKLFSLNFLWFGLCALVAWSLTAIFLWVWLFRFLRGKESGRALFERLGFVPRIKNRPVLWVHGASVGESMALEGVLRALLEKQPDLFIFLTTNTRTSQKLWRKKIAATPLFHNRLQHQMLPFDHPLCLCFFIHRLKPTGLLINEADLWPNMLFAAQRFGLRVLAFGVDLTEKTKKRWCYVPSLLREMLRDVNLCVTWNSTKIFFDKLGLQKVCMFPSLKWAHPLSSSVLTAYSALQKNSKKSFAWSELQDISVLTAASLHPGEEGVIIKAFTKLHKKYSHLRLILAPRYIKSVAAIEASLRQCNLSYVKWTDNPSKSVMNRCLVLLVDTMGALKEVFLNSRFVFMGGSLLEHMQGHNIIEPAFYDCVILHGPYMEKNQAIAQRFKQENAALCVDTTTFLSTMEDLLKAPKKAEAFVQASKRCVQTYGKKTLEEACKKVEQFFQLASFPCTVKKNKKAGTKVYF